MTLKNSTILGSRDLLQQHTNILTKYAYMYLFKLDFINYHGYSLKTKIDQDKFSQVNKGIKIQYWIIELTVFIRKE